MILLALVGCMDLDYVHHGNIHCTEVGEETCQEVEDYWDRVCTPCDVPYDWGRDYAWEPGTSARPIPEAAVTRVQLESLDGEGTLDLYAIAGHGENPDTAGLTVLYNHGRYGGIEPYMPRIRFLHEAGYDVVIWDYRGYGKSEPPEAPTPRQWFDDSAQVRAYVRDDLGVPDAATILYGKSLGAIPGVEMGVHDPGCALFLEVPMTSVEEVAEGNTTLDLPVSFFSAGHFENTEKIRDYAGPLLVMAVAEDPFYPLSGTEELYANAPGEKELWVVDAPHGIPGIAEADLDAYFDKMTTFLETRAPGCEGVERPR